MKDLKYVSNLIYMFQTFRKVNIATYLYNKSSKSLLHRWFYYVIPIFVFALNILNLVRNEVLYSPPNEFTYFNDLSNSLCLTLLYFLSYFLSGYYPLKFDEFIRKGIDRNFFYNMSKYSKSKKKSFLLLVIVGCILFGIGVLAGYSFYRVAEANERAYWIFNLDFIGRAYYCLFLGVTWYHSLSLLGMALTSGFVVYTTIKCNNIIYVDDDFNRNFSVMSATDIVISTFSYGIFYIIGSFLFIFNDKLSAERYKVYNTFHEDIPSLLLIFIISLLVIWAYLPLQELFLFMKKKKDCLINNLNKMIINEKIPERKDELISKRNDLIKQNLIYTTITNKIIFLLSVFIPSVGVILQGIDLFM